MKNYFDISIDENNIPAHIGIILDGNRRWAKQRGLPPMKGHKAGAENLGKIIKFSKKTGVKILSVYAFSTENWKRSIKEVNFLMNLLLEHFKINLKLFQKNKIKIVHSGRWSKIPSPIKTAIINTVKKTKNNDEFIFNVCFNYGGRSEIIDAVKKMYKTIKRKKFTIKKLNEKTFSQFLYHPEIPEPELIIRTSGEIRTSNFLLWESAYSEWHFSKKFWPDFDEKELIKSIKDYQERKRRFGK